MVEETLQIHYGEISQIPGTFRYVFISDTHDKLQYMNIPNGDVLIHAGDFSCRGTEEEIIRFNEAISRLPHTHKIVIAGNHELTFDIENEEPLKRKFPVVEHLDFKIVKKLLTSCIYLEDSGIMIGGYKLYGSPWSRINGNMAFNLNDEDIRNKWELIPKDTNILLTHSPPKGILDKNCKEKNHGCSILLEYVEEIRPMLHLFGHIHESYGIFRTPSTIFINGSSCVNHQLQNSPLVFDLPILS